MDHLPFDILLNIFSSLRPAELLQLEQACSRWQRVIQANFWNKLECITEETIDHPDGDYLNNLIQLSSRVAQVKQFVDPFSLLKDTPAHRMLEGEVNRAALELLKKLSPAAPFPLDVVRSVIHAELERKEPTPRPSYRSVYVHLESTNCEFKNGFIPTKVESPKSKEKIESMMKNTIKDIARETGLRQFRTLRINSLFIQDKQKDPFIVRWRGDAFFVPVKTKQITRLIIGRLVIPLSWVGWESEDAHVQVTATLNRISELRRLEGVEIESVYISVFPYFVGQEPRFDLLVEFHENQRQFSLNEFKSLFNSLGQRCASVRELAVGQFVKKWREDGRVKRAELGVASEYFMKMELALILGDKGNDVTKDCYQTMMAEVLSSFVDTLHLTYLKENKQDVLESLKFRSVFTQLKSLSFSLAYREFFGQLELWSVRKSVSQVRNIIRTIKDDLHSLENLTLRFTAGGNRCPSNLFSSTCMTPTSDPLPRLVTLECIGLPCLPFIASVVSRAPNLRRLSIGCQPFEDNLVGTRWISHVIDSASKCPRLEYLHIVVQSEEELSGVFGKRRSVNQTSRETQKRDTTRSDPLLMKIEIKLQTLRKCCPSLFHLRIVLDGFEHLSLSLH